MLQIQCACKSNNPVDKGVAALQQLEAYAMLKINGDSMPRFRHQHGSFLDTLEQGVAAVQSARDASPAKDYHRNESYPDAHFGNLATSLSSAAALDELELRIITSFLRAYQASVDAKLPTEMLSKISVDFDSKNDEVPSFTAFLLRACTLIAPRPKVHEGTTTALPLAAAFRPTAFSSEDGLDGHPHGLLSPSAVLDAVPEVIRGARFLLLQAGHNSGITDEKILGTARIANVGTKESKASTTIQEIAGPLGTSSEARALSIASWNVAQALRGRGLHSCFDDGGIEILEEHNKSACMESGSSGTSARNAKLPFTTELFLIAHELQLAGERSQSSLGEHETFELERHQDSVNRVGMLFLAATDLLDRILFGTAFETSNVSIGKSSGDASNGHQHSAPATRALVEKALGWICTAQETAALVAKAAAEKDVSGTGTANIESTSGTSMDIVEGSTNARPRDGGCSTVQNRAELMMALKGMQVSLSVLRLMAGLQGYLRKAVDTKETVTTAVTEEKALLSLLDECQTELALVPADKLSAAASAAKHRNHNAVAHRLLSIAISQMEAQGRGLGGSGIREKDGNFMAEDGCSSEKETLSRLYCDLFHASPTTDACLEVARNILHLLNDAAQAREVRQFMFKWLCLVQYAPEFAAWCAASYSSFTASPPPPPCVGHVGIL